MSSLASSLDIAGSGLATINAQLALVSHNLANAGTPGYVSEQLGQTSLTAGGQGEGVVTGVATRSLDAQLQQDLFAQNGVVSGLATTQTGLQPVDAAQGTVAAGNDLGSILANLDAAFTGLASNPSSDVQQAQVVSTAAQLAGKINSLAETYGTVRQNAQDSLVGSVKALNAALGTVGTLSDQIIAAQARGQSTADLENQRDAAVQAVSSLVDVKCLKQSNGDIVLTTSGGLTLPVHAGNPLSISDAVLGAGSARQFGDVPGILLGGQDVTTRLNGGSIGAEVTLRDVTLPTYQAELDEFSQTLSTRFSAQGLTLFTNSAGAVPAGGGVPAQTNYVGYAQSIQVNPAVQARPSLVRDGTGAITGSATGASAFTPNTDPSQTGFPTLIARVLDFSFGASVQPGIPQPAAATTGLGPAGTLAAPFGAAGSLSDFATSLVGSQSQDVATAGSRLSNEQAVQTTLQARFSSGSAVNTDTELATMVKLQAAYGANAKIFSAVQAMWSQLIAAVG